uniref:Ig-like domain-containing protein n=1 Tax=Cyprinus carpio TaxID=7962 RepID=A0A8C1YM98_CYPCA
MFRVLLVLLLWLTGNYFILNDANDFITLLISINVNQSPSNLIKSERDNAELVCEYNIPSYTRIFWYKQTLDSELNKFVANKTVAENGSLTVNNLQPNDSATYFCSVSEYTVHQTQGRAVQKTGVLK